MRCNFRGVKVPFRRWLSRADRARGVLTYASGLAVRGNAASTVLSRAVRNARRGVHAPSYRGIRNTCPGFRDSGVAILSRFALKISRHLFFVP